MFWRPDRRSRADAIRTSTARVVQLVLLILLALLVLTPLLWLVSPSLKGPAEDIFSSPPALLPAQPSLDAYMRLTVEANQPVAGAMLGHRSPIPEVSPSSHGPDPAAFPHWSQQRDAKGMSEQLQQAYPLQQPQVTGDAIPA